MEGVFINYRRDDSSGWANRLHKDLVDRFGSDRVFRDLNLEPGIDFKEAIADHLRRCKVQLVLIGRQWLTATDSKGRVRLQKADDLVRVEIAVALASNIRVIPVLVQDADMPTADDLPEDIRRLAERNAVELSDKRWDHDTKELMEVIRRVLGVAESPAQIAAPPTPSPSASNRPPATSRVRRSFGMSLWWLATALLFVGFGYLSFGLCMTLAWSGEHRRAMLALFGAGWGFASWLPVLRVVGLKGQGAHVVLAVVSWTIGWAFVWPSHVLVHPQDGVSDQSLAALLFDYSHETSMFYASLLMLTVVGSSGSILAVYLRLLWNKELRKELPILGAIWSLAVYLSYVIVVEILTGGGETRGKYRSVDVIGTFAIALITGSCIAAGFIGYWDHGNSLVRAIRSIPQSQDPRTPPQAESGATADPSNPS